jgi:hypothetical protein
MIEQYLLNTNKSAAVRKILNFMLAQHATAEPAQRPILMACLLLRLCLVPPKTYYLKKKILRHIKLAIHVWSTKCR